MTEIITYPHTLMVKICFSVISYHFLFDFKLFKIFFLLLTYLCFLCLDSFSYFLHVPIDYFIPTDVTKLQCLARAEY